MISVLYEDDYFMVFNKPPRLLVIPTAKEAKRTLVSAVNEEYRTNHPEETHHLHPCHRLDRDTTGCILFAKGKKNQKAGMDLFHKKAIDKVYIAVVHGTIKNKNGTIDRNLVALDRRKYAEKPKKAATQYKVLKNDKEYTVVRAQPITGRTNQIRIHFSQIGHPIVGERKYAFARDYDLKFKRTALHAYSLEFTHPMTQQQVQVVSTLPKDMEVFCDRNTIERS